MCCYFLRNIYIISPISRMNYFYILYKLVFFRPRGAAWPEWIVGEAERACKIGSVHFKKIWLILVFRETNCLKHLSSVYKRVTSNWSIMRFTYRRKQHNDRIFVILLFYFLLRNTMLFLYCIYPGEPVAKLKIVRWYYSWLESHLHSTGCLFRVVLQQLALAKCSQDCMSATEHNRKSQHGGLQNEQEHYLPWQIALFNYSCWGLSQLLEQQENQRVIMMVY